MNQHILKIGDVVVITMRVMGFAHDNSTDSPVLVLRQDNGESLLPIWIGQAEAYAIAMAASDEGTSRPLAHDIFLKAVESLGGRVTSFSIVDLQDGVFFGALDVLDERSGTLKTLDCRPSDGVAVAMLARVAILVDETVLGVAASRHRNNEPSVDYSTTPVSSAVQIMPASAKNVQNVADMTGFSPKNPPVTKDSVQENARLSELLQSLEPVSKRVM